MNWWEDGGICSVYFVVFIDEEGSYKGRTIGGDLQHRGNGEAFRLGRVLPTKLSRGTDSFFREGEKYGVHMACWRRSLANRV